MSESKLRLITTTAQVISKIGYKHPTPCRKVRCDFSCYKYTNLSLNFISTRIHKHFI